MRGGVRPGAGRPKITLAAVIDAGTFDWQNPTHRKRLFDEDVVGDEGLAELQRHYRKAHRMQARSDTSWFAQRFQDRVRELARDRTAA